MAVVLSVLLCRTGFRGFRHLAGGFGSLFAAVVLLGEHPVHGRTTHAERGRDCRDLFTAGPEPAQPWTWRAPSVGRSLSRVSGEPHVLLPGAPAAASLGQMMSKSTAAGAAIRGSADLSAIAT